MAHFSTRNDDNKRVNIVNNFLDKYVYPNTKVLKNFERVDDLKSQLSGTDVRFTYNGQVMNCDEKAAVKYVNKDLRTFSLELSFINRRGEWNEGWLTDNVHTNEMFMFIWIPKAKQDVLNSVDDIEVMDCAFVLKSDIMEALAKKGWTKEKLVEKDRAIRSGDTNFGNIRRDGFKFSYSDFLYEQPINILMTKEEYMKLAVCSYHIENKKIISSKEII